MVTLDLSSPWCPQFLPEAMRPEVIAQIPEGTRLGVACGKAPGRPWHLRLTLADDPKETIWKMAIYGRDLQAACLFALRKHARDAA